MAKTIKFTYKDVDYTLEFTRKSLEKMENDGIVLSQIAEKPVTMIPKMFKYSFHANHKRLSNELIEEMFNLFTDKNSLFDKLSEMAMDALNTLFEEPKEKNAIQWKASF